MTDIFAGWLRQPVFDHVDRLAKEFTRKDDGDIAGLMKDMVQLFDEYLRVMMWEFKNYDRHGLIFLFLIL